MLAARDMATRYDRPGWANDAVTTKARREFAAHYDQRDAQTVSASILQSLHADGFDQHLTDSAIKVLERISLTDLKVLDSSLRAQRNLPVDHVEFRDFAATQSSVGLANDVINSLNLVGHDSAHQFAGALQILGQQPVNNPNDSRHAVVAGLLAISPHGDTHTDALTRRVHQAESLIHHDSTAQATFALRAVSDGIATIYGNGDIFVPNSPEAPPTKLANIRDQEPSGASAVVNSGRPLPQAPPNAQQGIPPVGGQTRTTDNGVGSSASPQENKRHRKNLFDLIFGVRQSTNYGALRQIPHNAGTPGLGKIPQAPGGEVGANVGSAASTAKLVTSAKPSKPMAPRV